MRGQQQQQRQSSSTLPQSVTAMLRLLLVTVCSTASSKAHATSSSSNLNIFAQPQPQPRQQMPTLPPRTGTGTGMVAAAPHTNPTATTATTTTTTSSNSNTTFCESSNKRRRIPLTPLACQDVVNSKNSNSNTANQMDLVPLSFPSNNIYQQALLPSLDLHAFCACPTSNIPSLAMLPCGELCLLVGNNKEQPWSTDRILDVEAGITCGDIHQVAPFVTDVSILCPMLAAMAPLCCGGAASSSSDAIGAVSNTTTMTTLEIPVAFVLASSSSSPQGTAAALHYDTGNLQRQLQSVLEDFCHVILHTFFHTATGNNSNVATHVNHSAILHTMERVACLVPPTSSASNATACLEIHGSYNVTVAPAASAVVEEYNGLLQGNEQAYQRYLTHKLTTMTRQAIELQQTQQDNVADTNISILQQVLNARNMTVWTAHSSAVEDSEASTFCDVCTASTNNHTAPHTFLLPITTTTNDDSRHLLCQVLHHLYALQTTSTCSDYDSAVHAHVAARMSRTVMIKSNNTVVLPVDIRSYCHCSQDSSSWASSGTSRCDVGLCPTGMHVSEENSDTVLPWTYRNETAPMTCGVLDQVAPHVVSADDGTYDGDVCQTIQSHASTCCTTGSPSNAVMVNSSIVIRSTIIIPAGQNAATLWKSPAVHNLEKAYTMMVEQVVSDLLGKGDSEEQRRQLRSPPRRRRHLAAVLQLGSARLYHLEDVPCPPGSLTVPATGDAACHVVFGSYGLLLVDESHADSIVGTFKNHTDSAIDRGLMQEWFGKLDLNSILEVLGTADTILRPTGTQNEEDGATTAASSSLSNDDNHRNLAIGFGVCFVILLVFVLAAAGFYWKYLRHDKEWNQYLGKEPLKTDSFESFLDENDIKILQYRNHEDEEESESSPMRDSPMMDSTAVPNSCDDVSISDRKSSLSELRGSPSPMDAIVMGNSPYRVSTTMNTLSNDSSTSKRKAAHPVPQSSPMDDIVSPRDAMMCMDAEASPGSQGRGSIAKVLFEQRELDVWEENPDDIEIQLMTQMTQECTSVVDSCASSNKNRSWLSEEDSLNISADYLKGREDHFYKDGQTSPESRVLHMDALATEDWQDEPKVQGSPQIDVEGKCDEDDSDGEGKTLNVAPHVARGWHDEPKLQRSPESIMEDSYSDVESNDHDSDGEPIIFETLVSGVFPDVHWEETSASSSSEDLAEVLCFQGQRGHIGFPSP